MSRFSVRPSASRARPGRAGRSASVRPSPKGRTGHTRHQGHSEKFQCVRALEKDKKGGREHMRDVFHTGPSELPCCPNGEAYTVIIDEEDRYTLCATCDFPSRAAAFAWWLEAIRA